MTLLTVLKELSSKDLNRALNSNKGYFLFTVSVFNAGVSVTLKCTNIFKQINYGNWNGYDSIHENDELMQEFIKGVLKDYK